MDLLVPIIQRELDELWPRINFQECIRTVKDTFFEVIRPFLIQHYTRLADHLKILNKPKALNGNEVLSLHDNLLQYKRKRDSSFDDSDTEDDAISIGASTSGLSGTSKIKSAEFESEMNRIKENMNSVFEQKLKAQAADFDMRIKKLEEEMTKKFQNMQLGDTQTPKSIHGSGLNLPIPKAPPLPPPSKSALSSKIPASAPSKSTLQKAQPVPTPKGYDYRSELQAQLAKRREAMERDEKHHFEDTPNRIKKIDGNPIVSSILSVVPAPSSSPRSTRFLSSKNDSYQTDEEEWK